MIKQELDRIKERISNKDFLENKGLSNEVGIHVFCYKAEDELIVQDYIRRLKRGEQRHIGLLSATFMKCFSPFWRTRHSEISCRVRRKTRQKYLLDQLQKIATPEALLARWTIHPISKGRMFSS
jgi:hypothetical protein